MNLEGERVLITGGSSGIGQAIAEATLAKGAKVVITGRRPDVLKASVQSLRKGDRFLEGVAADVALKKVERPRLRLPSRSLADSIPWSTTPVASWQAALRTRPKPKLEP